MDFATGQRRGSRLRRSSSALGLGFALALVAVLSASAPTTIAYYAALANDLTPLFDPAAPGAVTSSPTCPSP